MAQRTVDPQVFYQTLKRPESAIKQIIWILFDLFASPCRMLIEVFIRRNFGERYFRLSSAVGAFFFYLFWPFIWMFLKSQVDTILSFPMLRPKPDMTDAMLRMDPAYQPMQNAASTVEIVGWGLFLLAFVAMSIWHYRRQRRAPSTFDFARYSYYNGDILPAFLNMKIRGKNLSRRAIECWLEPGIAFAAGSSLSLSGQRPGGLLMFSAIVYSISYCRAYRASDNLILDKIDQRIVNEELAKVLLDDKAAPSQTRWFDPPVHLPADPEQRQQVRDMVLADANEAPLAK